MKKARLYITARGIYDCMINGEQITERLLAPGLTQYDKRMNYQTYDITTFLKKGKNGIGVTLASGWWSEAQTYQLKNFNYFGDKEALLAKIEAVYVDGTTQIIVTDPDTWKYYGEGPYRYAGFFAGEIFDARLKSIYANYSAPFFDDHEWRKPEVIEPASIEQTGGEFGQAWPALDYKNMQLEGSYDAPVYVVEERSAVTVTEVEKGVYIYDLQQEMAGVPRICLREECGTKVTIRYAEVLYPNLPESGENVGKMMLENYRDATSTDVYICSGEGREIFQPKFTFHGYRYIEISGVKNPPKPEAVVSLQYSSVKQFDGEFESSNALLNRFAENVFWSQKCNFINIPTDCPQRNERMGWAGDTHVFCHTALQNSNLKLFYERNLQAMADLQTKCGRFPEIAPMGGGFGGITYESASIYIAWELYQQYGDKRTLKKFYPGMVRYMKYLQKCGLPEQIDKKLIGPIDDWLALELTDSSLIWNAFYYRNADIMSHIAEVLGEEQDCTQYKQLAEKIKKFWNDTYVDSDTKKTKNTDGSLCDTQCSYAIGIMYHIADEKEKFGKHLKDKCEMRKNTIGTGFFGTGMLNFALSDRGNTETAYAQMLQTQYPSWLYPVTQGATTIWEHWDSYTKEKGFNGQNAMNSFNHYSLGSVLAWMYQVILGINRDEKIPGYQRIYLRPQPVGLQYAKGSVASPYGKISAEWKLKNDGLFEYKCEIPVNTTATVYLPDKTVMKIGSGKYCFQCKIKNQKK